MHYQMNTYIEIAYKHTKNSTHPQHAMSAVVVKGGRILSVAHNLDRRRAHCEVRALRPHQDFTGATIIVVRSNGRISKPCPTCRAAIKKAGIKRIVFIDENCNIVKEKP